MSIAVFLPTRKGSQRIPDKNTKYFGGLEGGLLELKLLSLVDLGVQEIILSTNDEKSMEIARRISRDNPKLRIESRPDNLASSTTKLTDLIKYVPSITSCDHILWTHVTSPFVSTSIYEEAIEKYKNNLNMGFDSLMSVSSFKNFLWNKDKKDIINRNSNDRWPQTQDLEDLYEINSAIFISPRNLYIDRSDRVGMNPYLYELNKIQSLDIDWEDDFIIAEAVYEKIYRKK